MRLWARVGVLGTLACCVHNRKRAVAEPRRKATPLTSNRSSDEPELKLVQVFFRHGARTPISTIPGVERVSGFWDRAHLLFQSRMNGQA